jgi:hypothetical protein
MLGGADLGTSAAAGATAGVAARKALAASLQGRQLARRAQGLRAHIAEQNGSNPALMEILSEIDREQGLWQSGAIDNGQFAEQLNEIVKKYRAVSAGPLALPSGSGE